MNWLYRCFEDMSLRKSIAIALVVGLAVPVVVSALIHLTERRATLLERLEDEHGRIVEVLAFGMQTPLWEIRPEAGRSLIDAVMLDKRVTSISVTSPLQPQFLADEEPQRRQGRTLIQERTVSRNGEEIGRVRVEMDTGLLDSQLAGQWAQTLLSGFLQFATGIFIIFALLRYKVLEPVRRLVDQSEGLAEGALNQSLGWRRSDELGVLGRSFEKMRCSLSELVSSLEKRNRDLEDREMELASQASILQATLDNMTDGIALVDSHFFLVTWNNRLIELLDLPRQLFYQGVSIEELIRFDLAQGGHDPVDRETIVRALRKTYKSGQESMARYRTGRGRFIEIRRRSMPSGGFVSTYTDVTEQVEAQREARDMAQALRESEQRYRGIVETAANGIVMADGDGRIVEFNPAAERIFGCRRDQALGRTIAGLLVPSHLRARHEEGMARFKATGESRVLGRVRETEGVRADGVVFPIELTLTTVPQGERYLFAADIRDISERKRAESELARHREALYQSEKLTALGSLLAGVAHELNNPLSVVVGRAIMLEEQLRDTSAGRSICKIRAAAERCARIVKTFLAMARRQEPMRTSVQICDVIQGALDMVGYGLKAAGVQVGLELEPDLPELRADPDQLTQVFTNLLVNAQHALEAIEGGHRVVICAQFDRPANALRIRVEDNGLGIAPEIRSRIFEPFFTTKPVGEGTGVGLSVSHSIIQAHGGTISVDEMPSGGTLFEIVLPIETVEDRPRAEPAPECVAGDGSRILIVDDEPEVARILADILADGGHGVETASSGRTALERLEGRDFDLILSDLRMPDMDGPGLYAALNSRVPSLGQRMIFVTGDTLSGGAKRFLAESGRPVIEKPFVPDEIRRTVAHALEAVGRSSGLRTHGAGLELPTG